MEVEVVYNPLKFNIDFYNITTILQKLNKEFNQIGDTDLRYINFHHVNTTFRTFK